MYAYFGLIQPDKKVGWAILKLNDSSLIMEKSFNHSNDNILIVGLGNPGREFKNNRHNVGFMLVDRLATKLEVKFTRYKFNSLYITGQYKNYRVILVKPQAYMNLSGNTVHSFVRFYKLHPEQLFVIYDDVDLPLETIRLRSGGGSAGHKGMQSIIGSLGTQEFPRLRIGIGRPKGQTSTPAFVLQNFSDDETKILPFVLGRASDAVLDFIAYGIDHAMNLYNSKVT
jgi:PTH1 family peptidyl-tRNA hydrolase